MLAPAFPFSKSLPDRKPPGIPFRVLLLAVWGWLLVTALPFPGNAQVPAQIHFQGRVQVGAADFSGTGQFKFALVSADGAASYWSNDGSSVAGAAPAAAVSLPVSKGVYGLLLGDPSLANMTPLPADAFAHPDVRLRVWFNDGANGFQQLSPDQRIAAVAYAQRAQVAASVPAGSITTDRLEPALQSTVSQVGELYGAYAWNLRTNPPPARLPGTMSVTPSFDGRDAQDIRVVRMPESRHSVTNTTDSYRLGNADELSRLIVQRAVSLNGEWRQWVAYCQETAAVPIERTETTSGAGGQISKAQYDKIFRQVTLQFAGQPPVIVRLQSAFPVDYRVEQGSDGIFYETLTLQPKTYAVE